MKTKKILASILLVICLLSCSQDKVVELPLTIQNGYGPFSAALGGMSANSEDENNPWKKTYLRISKFPEGLSDMKCGHIETNIYQSVYQDYFCGNITSNWYENLQKLWLWEPDTLNLSKNPIKTKIAFVYGIDSEGILKIAVDANNNLDLSDDKLFVPLEASFDNIDSLAQVYAFNVSFETFFHNEVVPVTLPLLVMYFSKTNMFICNFSQYATTQYKGVQISISSNDFTNLSYQKIDVAFTTNLKKGEKVKKEDIYKKNEYIEIKDVTYKILGVNTNKNVLVLERDNQAFSTQIGYKPYPFQGTELTNSTAISSESLKGKYVLLDFWAESCIPCIAEFPKLKELYAKTDRAKFEIIGIVGNSTHNGIKRLIEKHEVPWPQILSDEIVKKYGVKSYPTTFLIDTEGFIVAKDLRGKELEEKILNLIDK